jgi:hypothetical protein
MLRDFQRWQTALPARDCATSGQITVTSVFAFRWCSQGDMKQCLLAMFLTAIATQAFESLRAPLEVRVLACDLCDIYVRISAISWPFVLCYYQA